MKFMVAEKGVECLMIRAGSLMVAVSWSVTGNAGKWSETGWDRLDEDERDMAESEGEGDSGNAASSVCKRYG